MIMVQTETDFGSRVGFVLAWGILNFVFIGLLRRPALSGALSLTLVVVLVLLSQLKHDVVQMTANFVDVMVIDRDSAAFLFTIFPDLRWSVILAALVTIPLMYALWWLDPFRIRRLPASAGLLACLAVLSGQAFFWPVEAWRGYYDDGYLSKFARSGVTAVSASVNYGFMESEAVLAERLKVPLGESCHVAGRRPHIIMIHDKSSFDIRQANGVKVPAGYGSHFKSFDGRQRKFLAESSGGASWMAEYNVLAGLSSRSFGRFSYFVTRIASGRVERACRWRCAAAATAPSRSIPPMARSWERAASRPPRASSTSMMPAISAPRASSRTPSSTTRQRTVRGTAGQHAAVRLCLSRRQSFSVGEEIPSRVAAVLAQPRQRPHRRRISAPPGDQRRATTRLHRELKKKFPAQPFLIVRYGDHQPEFSSNLLDPGSMMPGVARKFDTYDPRYFTTYYAIDAINSSR